MPIYINRTNAGKNQMPRAGFEPTTPRSHERCSNHWATEATTVEWVEYWLQRNIDYQTFAPRPLGLGITSVDRRDNAHRTRCCRSCILHVTRHISNKLFIIREINCSWERFIKGNNTQTAVINRRRERGRKGQKTSEKHEQKVNALKLLSAWLRRIEQQKEERRARKQVRNANINVLESWRQRY